MNKLIALVSLLPLALAAAPVPRNATLPQDLRTALDDPSDLAATCTDFVAIRAGHVPGAQRPPLHRAQAAWRRRLDTLLPRIEADQLAGSTVNVLMNGNSRAQIATAAAWCVAHTPR